jgi:hypothetical protein
VSRYLYLGGTKINSTAVELNLLAGKTAVGVLGSVTEGSNTGVRLSRYDAANYGDIGSNAVDLSYSGSESTTYGANGYHSTAMGHSTTASGDYSTAMGFRTDASGARSTAMGTSTIASDYSSLVIGSYNLSGSSVTNSEFQFNTANTAFVIGNGTVGDPSDAFKVMFNGDTTVSGSVTATEFIGDGSQLTGLPTGGDSPFSPNDTDSSGIQSATNTASGASSTAMGYGTTASGSTSTAMGNYTTASGLISTAMGDGTTASGAFSTAMGRSTTASDFGSLVIGQYNSSGSTVTNSATTYDADNTAFVIGNGTASNAKSDAFKVMFNGDATVSNDLTVSGDVVVSSDARLKSNIVSLGSTLSRLLLIDGKTYTMIKDGKQKIGVLAQDIREVFPELVTEDANEMLAVNYQGLVPVLINALKEQDAKMNEQQTEIDELKEMVQALVSRE